jgi:hypothetical protein
MTTLITDPDLALLDSADVDDLVVLIDHITDKGEGRISLSTDACKTLASAKASRNIPTGHACADSRGTEPLRR